MSLRTGYTVAFLLCLALTAGAAEPAREELLAQGEKALQQGDAQRAARLFEQAGFVKHAADAEIGLTRAYMQAGEYRRALSFAAHTAGAHPDSSAGGALYAQLLDLGGQTQIAARLLERAGRSGEWGRFAPASPDSATLPQDARVASSGALAGGGRMAFSPAAALRGAERVWVRNGLGAVAPARVLRRIEELDLAILELDRALAAAVLETAARDPFPGSPGFAVEYEASGDTAPAWPLLRPGFIGKPSPGAGTYQLGIEMPPGLRGGPVFDASGRLAGLAVADAGHGERLIPASLLKAQLAEVPAESPAAAPLAVDEIYERALGATLQVIVAR